VLEVATFSRESLLEGGVLQRPALCCLLFPSRSTCPQTLFPSFILGYLCGCRLASPNTGQAQV
jgi:hypothetical protein